MIGTPLSEPWEVNVTWVRPEFTRGEVNRAGKTVLESSDAVELMKARRILTNWRSAHGYPLNALTMTLKNRCQQAFPRPGIISQRLKRLVSIENKLLRRPHVRTTQIQDIGGCRAVLHSISAVDRLVEIYETRKSRVFQLHRVDDYIVTPKRYGYRSKHLVYKYCSDKSPAWENMRIELQLRSYPQHYWATAVEAVSFFTGQDLKASEGSQAWLRLFELMAHVMALEEKCPGIEGIPDDETEVRGELRELWEELEADVLLSGWAHGFNQMKIKAEEKEAWRFLLHLNAREKWLTITTFGRAKENEAAERSMQLELELAEDPFQHVVLVSVESIRQLDRAYPGFFADTTAFREAVLRAISV